MELEYANTFSGGFILNLMIMNILS